MGGTNYPARIRFPETGSVWLVRVPRVNGCIPQSLIDYLLPASRAFGYGIAGDKDNKVDVSYILMEQMPGKVWNLQGPRGKDTADKDNERVWSGLADILIELAGYPFPQAGSLLSGPSPSEPIVSALASERFLVLSPEGPFDTAADYYASFVEQNLALVADGQLCSQIQDLAARPGKQESVQEFYIKHVDDKGDHLMVDDKLNITGIIDWHMARVVPAHEAFGPLLSSLTTHDRALARFLDTKGAIDLADLMRKDDKLRRGIWGAFGADQDTDWRSWKLGMLREYSCDPRLRDLIARYGKGP
ncbi:hypothetical protein BDW62DRAFT_211883 [Aspergillus aurantiobrunneus]